MSDWENVYNNPEKHGLEVVAEIEYSDRNYHFDTRMVWLHKETGFFFTMRDSGCSCPSPFEDYNDIHSLDYLDLTALKTELNDEVNSSYSRISPQYAQDEYRKVEAAVKAAV